MGRNGYMAPKPQRSVWSVIGIALGAVLFLAGLLYVGVMVCAFIALSSSASNK